MVQSIDIQENKIVYLGKDKPYVGKEDSLQIACANWLRAQFPHLLWFHVPNGGFRRDTKVWSKKHGRHINIPVEAMKFKNMGVLAGTSDFIFLESSGPYHGLIIELKVKGGALQPSQITFLNNCLERNYKVVVCWNIEAFITAVNWYLNLNK